jgi:predicted GIY-YIG superfamily endonuclease
MTEIRDTYKYWFKVGNLKVKCGITDDLSRREREHQNSGRYTVFNGARYYWSEGHIYQEGNITTRESALEWERVNGCNRY